MPFISEEIIDKIRERNNIADVISEYVSLKRNGANFKALCPFHAEKTPSFVVNTQKQIFHCFGCGVGGNVFSFLMKRENIEFPDAVKILAERAGIEIVSSEKHDAKKEEEKKGLLRLIDEAGEYYHKNLLNSEEAAGARSYLKNRDIDAKTISKYKIGYASLKIKDDFLRRGFSQNDMLAAGLLVKGESGYYPKFRNRVIFPIFDIKNRILGFGGRVLDNSMPKYLNSPDSRIYHKGEILYGLNFAKDSIRNEGSVFIVEGYFDLIRMQISGVENTVATLGTALTADQIRLLSRLCERIYFVYDPDTAGQSAALRGMELVKKEGIDVKVLCLPDGKDPDIFLLSKKKDAFIKLRDLSLDFFDFCFSQSLKKNDIKTISGKTKVIEALADIIYNSPNPIEKDNYIKKIADKLYLKEDLVILTLQKLREGKRDSNNLSKILDIENKSKNVEKKIIQLLIKRPDLILNTKDVLSGEHFKNIICRRIYEELLNFYSVSKDIDINRIMNGWLGEKEVQNIVSELVCEDVDYYGNEMKYLNDYIQKIKINTTQDKLKMMSSEIRFAQEKNDDSRVKDLLIKYQELDNTTRRRNEK
ncbi:MAG: DNA primase [bacterium]|nr:DNA primase [bacterium]